MCMNDAPAGSVATASSPGGRGRLCRLRKVRTPQGRVLGNAQAGRPDGKCNREQTADGRVSGTGKGETVV